MAGIASIVSMLSVSLQTWGQDLKYPVIGEKIPSFQFSETYKLSDQTSISSSEDLIGSFYILDFWSIGCAGCVLSFPKLNLLQSKFDDRIKIILVGRETEPEKYDIRKAYAKYESKMNLDLISIFDSSLYKRFVPVNVPHLIWVNDKGSVVAITTSADITANNVEAFLSNRKFYFGDVSYQALQKAKNSKSTGMRDSIGRDLIYKSELYLVKQPSPNDRIWSIDYFLNKGEPIYSATSAKLFGMLNMAFFGKSAISKFQGEIWPWPLIHFDSGSTIDLHGNTSYDYFLEIDKSKASRESVMRIMQRDLQSAFGLNVSVVTGKRQYYEFVIMDSTKVKKILREGIGKEKATWKVELNVNRINAVRLSNVPMMLSGKILDSKFVMLDATYLDLPVSFSIEADITDINSIRKGLQKVGFDLLLKEKEFKVLEIRANPDVRGEIISNN